MEINITIKIDDCEVVNVTKEIENEVKTEDKAEINVSHYARFFDDGCIGWEKDSEYNLMFLKAQQDYANDRLKAEGHLFLNEVYDMLGIPRSKEGQLVGWIYRTDNPVGDNRVDFGLHEERNSDFVNGRTNVILLDFNVDGNILELIE